MIKREEAKEHKFELWLLKDIYNFIIHPELGEYDFSIKEKVKNFFRVFFLDVIFIALVLGIGSLISMNIDFNLPEIRSRPVCGTRRWWYSILITSFFTPVWEEVIFRLSLKYSTLNFSLSTGALVVFLLPYDFPDPLSLIYRMMIVIIVVILLATIIYVFLRITKGINNTLERVFTKHFRGILYCYTVLFGLVHIFRYSQLTWLIILLSPILTWEKIVSGFLTAFLRVRQGFIWAVFRHILFNFLLALITWLNFWYW